MKGFADHRTWRLAFAGVFGVVCMVMGAWQIGVQEVAALQKNIAEEVLRFHVVAHSDVAADQQLKLEVRDAVLQHLNETLTASASKEETLAYVSAHLDDVERVARAVVAAHGYAYDVTATVTRTLFPRKTYGTETLPAGDYDALNITIGEGDGQNWWCVLFPPLCYCDESTATLEELLGEDEYALITNTSHDEVEVRFWIVDFVQELFAGTV